MRSAALVFALLIILPGLLPTAAAAPLDAPVSPHSAASGEHARPIAAGPPGTFEQTTATATSLSKASTEIRISLGQNGDAQWYVTFRYHVSQNESAAFQQYGREFAAGDADVEFDTGLFRTAASRASTAAGREMRIENVSRTWRLDNSTGALTLSFTWTNFVEVRDDGSLRLGDAFETPGGGTWLSSLGADQRLVIVTPSDYVVNSTSFPLLQQENAVVIAGPREFNDEERLVVTYRRATAPSDLPWTLLVGGAVLVALIVLVAVAVRRRQGLYTTNGGVTDEGTDADAGAEAEPRAGTDEATERVPPPEAGEGASEGGEAGTPEGQAEDVDLDLLSDEERVEYLLRQRGGRMKQANIVKETGWSDAKVSQLLSAMADAGRVNKLRLGRENLISLVEEDDEDGDAPP